MMLTVPCWLWWETNILFSCEKRIKRKKNAERALLSIHLFISLSSLSLDLSLHIPHVLPYSFWPFVIFLCPTAFWSLTCSFVFPSCPFLLFFTISCLPFLSNRPFGLLFQYNCILIPFPVSLFSPTIPTFCLLSWPEWIQHEASEWFRWWDSLWQWPCQPSHGFSWSDRKGSQSLTPTRQCGQKVKTIASP